MKDLVGKISAEFEAFVKEAEQQIEKGVQSEIRGAFKAIVLF